MGKNDLIHAVDVISSIAESLKKSGFRTSFSENPGQDLEDALITIIENHNHANI